MTTIETHAVTEPAGTPPESGTDPGAEWRAVQDSVTVWARRLCDAVAAGPMGPEAGPGWVLARLPTEIPERPEPVAAVVAALDAVLRRAGEPWTNPERLAQCPATVRVPSLLGRLLADLHTSHVWPTNLAATELEVAVVDQLGAALGLPAHLLWRGGGGGSTTDSGTSSAQLALLAALMRASSGRWQADGAARRERVYVTRHTHSSVRTATLAAGLGLHGLRQVAHDPHTHAMSPTALARALADDIAAGHRPVMVVATVGTTSTGAVDDLRVLGKICAAYGVWLHVDAAWGGCFALLPEYQTLFQGAEYASSVAVSPHKLLHTGLGCAMMWTSDPGAVTGALAVSPDYLRTQQIQSAVDLRDWQLATRRPDRALALWMTVRSHGLDGLRAPLRHHIMLASELADWARHDPQWTVGAPPSLGLVCLHRHTGGGLDADNAATTQVLHRLVTSDRVLCSSTIVDRRVLLRFAPGTARHQHLHVVIHELATATTSHATCGSDTPTPAADATTALTSALPGGSHDT